MNIKPAVIQAKPSIITSRSAIVVSLRFRGYARQTGPMSRRPLCTRTPLRSLVGTVSLHLSKRCRAALSVPPSPDVSPRSPLPEDPSATALCGCHVLHLVGVYRDCGRMARGESEKIAVDIIFFLRYMLGLCFYSTAKTACSQP